MSIFVRLISEALRRMNGKFLEIASSHVSARVLQVSLASGFLVLVLLYFLIPAYDITPEVFS